MSRVAFPPSPSQHPVAVPVVHGAVLVEGDAPSAVVPRAADGAHIYAFAKGDIVTTAYGDTFVEGVVIAHDRGMYMVAVAHPHLPGRVTPVARDEDELEAVVW